MSNGKTFDFESSDVSDFKMTYVGFTLTQAKKQFIKDKTTYPNKGRFDSLHTIRQKSDNRIVG